MATKWARSARPIAGSCPTCLGDLSLQPVTGGWALICQACGTIVSGGSVRRTLKESVITG